ncbi:MAG: DUF2520 domain-containing protein [Sphingopyxis sp.]|uniref:Rossmann-like and DUF2520 domain-containing protein n=1 Tax=Sphingopyxis sp. TaxID=1908224 RepID=UPI001A5710B5|nr:Rossmann-like and DUF2520 domain-containing protein [Sphingopyxis sp.]MBL9070996.1 DUF2520 domain-containing protein [Sphingopyxis sp.]
MDTPAFQRIGIVGSGRVARALALALVPHSPMPLCLSGRMPEKLSVAAAQTGALGVCIDDLARDCDVIAITVSDEALAAVAADLATMIPEHRTPFVFHVSGSSGAAILAPLRRAGAMTAAIHPAMTFTGDAESEVGRMTTARFAITGDSRRASELAHHIVGLLGGVPVDVDEARRPLYHAALCHASNHLVTLMTGASHALAEAGVDHPEELLAPLVRAALENSLERGFAALSGPLLRGDHQTVEGHLMALGSYCPDLLPAYRAMALATLDELQRSGSPDAASAIRRKLG